LSEIELQSVMDDQSIIKMQLWLCSHEEERNVIIRW
jgi:hypothetical protein